MWAALLLVLLFGTIFALLSVPARVSLDLERERTLNAVVRLRWLFVRLQRELTRRTPKSESRKKERRRPQRGVGLRTLAAAGRVPGLRQASGRFAKRLARSIRVVEVAGSIRLGSDDPADTGRLLALVGPLMLWCNRWPKIRVGVEPDFSGARLAGELGGTIEVHPARFVYAVALALFSPAAVRLALAVRRNRVWKR